MSAYTTLFYSAQKAKEKILHEVISASLSDEKLERIMDILLEDALYNCRITESGQEPEWCYE